MNLLEVVDVTKTYTTGDQSVQAIGRMNFGLAEREFLCVVGPSGCGKTTLIKCIAGLLPPTSGEVLLRGRPVTGPPEELAVVFQEYSRSLMPWMSVRRNVELPLLHKNLTSQRREQLVTDALASVGLAHAAGRYPWQLSGGMQQRVAIARALAYEPQILLMDEPFASVDAQTRSELEDTMLELRDQYGVTVLFVTHDIDEAVYLGDRVVVLTPSPTEVQEILPVNIGHPRDQVATKMLPEFVDLRAHVYEQISRSARRPAGHQQAPSRTPERSELGQPVQVGLRALHHEPQLGSE